MRINHGFRKIRAREYRSWEAMKRRCLKKTDKKYKDYGGRGITVCERWLNFLVFYEDMGECPDGKTLNRKDNNGNYEPSNCNWVDGFEQANNKQNSFYITYKGRTLTLANWARELKVSKITLWCRLKRNKMPIELAFTLPFKSNPSVKRTTGGLPIEIPAFVNSEE